jgi:hypothetical integral membrane protein (TIGR02206 family)
MPTTTQAADASGPFPAFGAGHMIVLAVLVIATAIACAVGIRWRGTAGLRRAERVAGAFMLLVYITATIYWLLPANFQLYVSIPIHMCDMTGLLAPLVLLFPRRVFRTLLYFWGLGLSIHGVLTPVLDHGPEHVTFYLYWLVHLSIIGTAVYDVVARRYRPRWRDCLIAIGWSAVWLAVVLVVDLRLNVNYGYVGNVVPDRPTVIDSLGPWPLRVYKMFVAVLVLFVGMWLPWAIAGRRRERRFNRRTGSGQSVPSAAADR